MQNQCYVLLNDFKYLVLLFFFLKQEFTMKMTNTHADRPINASIWPRANNSVDTATEVAMSDIHVSMLDADKRLQV